MESQSKIYVKVNGSTNDDGYDIGLWKGGQLVCVKFGYTPGYGKRMYIDIRDLDDGGVWGLEFDRFVNVKVFLKLSDLDLETKQITNTRDFILTEDNMEELKKMIEDSKGESMQKPLQK